jgi:hypothetical protein
MQSKKASQAGNSSLEAFLWKEYHIKIHFGNIELAFALTQLSIPVP